MQRLIVERYEERQRELLVENQDLRAALQQLQADLMDVLNHAPSGLSGQLSGDKGILSVGTPPADVEGRCQESPFPRVIIFYAYQMGRFQIFRGECFSIKPLFCLLDRLCFSRRAFPDAVCTLQG